MLAGLAFPAFDPVALQIGPIGIRWYALAYIGGIVLGWRLMKKLSAEPPVLTSQEKVDDFLTWVTLGIILGGRLGYVVFYRPSHFLANPLEILQLWAGGMSFHGGMLGVIVAAVVYCRRNGIDFLAFIDRAAVVTPIGLFLGRLANFVNGELWGRPWNGPWSMVFPADPLQLPRHPSQLYQAALEGLVLFALLWVVSRREAWRSRRGLLSGLFLVGYGLARVVGELFREPDGFLGFVAGGVTMGQVLSMPMLLLGGALVVWSGRGMRGVVGR